jgi:hypothetical protein
MAILKTYSLRTAKPSKGIKYRPTLKSLGMGIKSAKKGQMIIKKRMLAK